MTSSPKLLEAFNLHGMELANRVALAPMTRSRAGEERIPNDLMAEYYTQRASAGLLITEATTISPQANGWNQSPGIYTDAMQAGWSKIVDRVHGAGGRFSCNSGIAVELRTPVSTMATSTSRPLRFHRCRIHSHTRGQATAR